jgi:hypothetical protein
LTDLTTDLVTELSNFDMLIFAPPGGLNIAESAEVITDVEFESIFEAVEALESTVYTDGARDPTGVYSTVHIW